MNQESQHTAHQFALLFQQGEEEALSFFYHEFYPALTFFADRWLNNRSMAEEIAADAFIKTWKMHWKLDCYPAIRAYLYKTVHRDCVHALKKEKKRNETHQQSGMPIVTNDTPFEHMVRSEVYRLIHSALKDLSAGNQKVVTMYYLEGKTTGQIARELNLSPNTINTQKTRGLEALRKKFKGPILFLFYLQLSMMLAGI